MGDLVSQAQAAVRRLNCMSRAAALANLRRNRRAEQGQPIHRTGWSAATEAATCVPNE
jgi:hypothetical protein